MRRVVFSGLWRRSNKVKPIPTHVKIRVYADFAGAIRAESDDLIPSHFNPFQTRIRKLKFPILVWYFSTQPPFQGPNPCENSWSPFYSAPSYVPPHSPPQVTGKRRDPKASCRICRSVRSSYWVNQAVVMRFESSKSWRLDIKSLRLGRIMSYWRMLVGLRRRWFLWPRSDRLLGWGSRWRSLSPLEIERSPARSTIPSNKPAGF